MHAHAGKVLGGGLLQISRRAAEAQRKNPSFYSLRLCASA